MAITFDLRHDPHTVTQVINYLQGRASEVEAQGRAALASELRLVCVQLQDVLEAILQDMQVDMEIGGEPGECDYGDELVSANEILGKK